VSRHAHDQCAREHLSLARRPARGYKEEWHVDDQPISEFQMTSAVSANPVIRFPLRAARSGTLRVVFVNSEGRRWEVAQPLRI